MRSTGSNVAVLSAAGSRKTERIVESALQASKKRILVTTYTSENQAQIVARFMQKVGCVPRHVTIMGWYGFLISQWAMP